MIAGCTLRKLRSCRKPLTFQSIRSFERLLETEFSPGTCTTIDGFAAVILTPCMLARRRDLVETATVWNSTASKSGFLIPEAGFVASFPFIQWLLFQIVTGRDGKNDPRFIFPRQTDTRGCFASYCWILESQGFGNKSRSYSLSTYFPITKR